MCTFLLFVIVTTACVLNRAGWPGFGLLRCSCASHFNASVVLAAHSHRNPGLMGAHATVQCEVSGWRWDLSLDYFCSRSAKWPWAWDDWAKFECIFYEKTSCTYTQNKSCLGNNFFLCKCDHNNSKIASFRRHYTRSLNLPLMLALNWVLI